MSKPSFIYVTYIESTPEKVRQALTDPAFTRRYWVNHRNASDWQAGSDWRHEDYDDASLVDIVGKVVESSPPTHLVLTCGASRCARGLRGAAPRPLPDRNRASQVAHGHRGHRSRD
jgi:uncharacterized protein YndB with AHSA1/START domain